MKFTIKTVASCLLLLIARPAFGGIDQTDTFSPIQSEASLPYTIQIEQAGFTLPAGIQSFVSATHKGKWLILCGRTNGMHTFNNEGNNFPILAQNQEVFVVDPANGTTWHKSLTHESSGLSQAEIETLSTTAAQAFQKGNTLYVVGGYGADAASGGMGTKSTLTAIDIHKMMQWVIEGKSSAKKAIRQISHPLLQVTGGFLSQVNDHEPFLLILGQNFSGFYRGESNGEYTEQIRPFWLNDDGNTLSILPTKSTATHPDYRRRDLNVLPVIRDNAPGYIAFSGVFTLKGGVWTVPIIIHADGSSFQLDPNAPETFKQGMNQYDCPAFGLYSTKNKEMFVLFPGGLSVQYFENGELKTKESVPFINQVTTVKIDKHNHISQYIMSSEYPTIPAVGGPHPGNTLLFGAEAEFFVEEGIPVYSNGVIQLDALPNEPTRIGYIVGGIMSTVQDTEDAADSSSSPHVFTVTLIPKKPS